MQAHPYRNSRVVLGAEVVSPSQRMKGDMTANTIADAARERDAHPWARHTSGSLALSML